MKQSSNLGQLVGPLALFASISCLSSCGGGASELPVPVEPWHLGNEPGTSVSVMEDHSDLLIEWLQRGFQGYRVLHIDTHDDCRVSDAEDVSTATELAEDGDWAGLAEGSGVAAGAETPKLFNIGDFIHAAWRMGVVDELVWVLPGERKNLEDIETVKSWLGAIGFDQESASSFRMVDGHPRGQRAGLPVTLCTLDDIPRSSEPSLVSLDIDYFMGSYHGSQDEAGLAEVLELFGRLAEAGVMTPHVGISYSVHGASIPLELHYLGDELADLFRDPGLFEAVPAAFTQRQEALDLMNRGELTEARRQFEDLASAHPGDASYEYSLAQLNLLDGDDLQPVFEHLDRALTANPVYYLGFVELSYWVRTDPRFKERDQDALFGGLLSRSTRIWKPQHENGDHAMLAVSYFEAGNFRQAQIESYHLIKEAQSDFLAGFHPSSKE